MSKTKAEMQHELEQLVQELRRAQATCVERESEVERLKNTLRSIANTAERTLR
jgi:uncharacterized protein YlxW (UPF0749 family)